MIGQKLKDRYDVLELIGSGGMATVYLAYCNYLKRNVAIKLLTNVAHEDEEDPLSFEAKAIARVSHTNIVSVYDMFEDQGKTFIVMEYVKGNTLKDYIHASAPLDEREIVALSTKLASALNAAHTSGVIHRDIKPENIILDPNGEPKITDFGIAHVSNEGTIVRSDQIFGSLRYASPEQLKGNIVDERSDIYSLGIVMYEMATGKMPFPDESPVTAAFRKLKEPLPGVSVLNPRISRELEQIILKATAIEPAQRYHSMLEMYLALQKMNEGTGPAPVYPAAPPAKPTYKSSPVVINSKKDRYVTPADEPSGSLMPLWMGLLLGAIVSAIILVMTLGSSSANPANITVPDVTQVMTYQQAKDSLNELGLYAEIEATEYHQTLAKGYVISQKEAPGSLAKHKDIIHLTVSRGPQPGGVPDFTNLTKQQAIERAAEFDINLEFEEEFHPDVRKDLIIEQSVLKDSPVEPGMTIILTVSKGPEDKKVEVPKLTGETRAKALSLLKELKLRPETSERFSDTVPEGEVISQSPSAGTEVRQDSVVDLVISKGPETKLTTVPDVVNLTHAEANNALRNRKLQMDFSESFSDTVADGRVISQDPVPESRVAENTVVSLVISKGKEQVSVTVPNVVGHTQERALQLLSEAKLEMAFTLAYSDTVEEGRVISQNPTAGNTANAGSTVNVVISRGPEKDAVEYRSLMVKVPYSDIPTDPFTIRIVYELDGDRVESSPVNGSKEAGKTEFESVTSIPLGATWYLYVNDASSPLQQGIIK